MKEAGKAAVRQRADEILAASQQELSAAQELLFADDRYAVLVILQAMDAAGKDGTIKHVMSGVNPQGCQVFSFKHALGRRTRSQLSLAVRPSCVPERGRIGIFNRSYYEDVLVVRVHPELLEPSASPAGKIDEHFWRDRYEDINAFERHLTRNGTMILKFFLNISQGRARKRLPQAAQGPGKALEVLAGRPCRNGTTGTNT